MTRSTPRRKRGAKTIQFPLEEYLDDTIGIIRTSDNSRGERECICECPVCGKPGKFYANTVSGLAVCFSCGERRNLRGIVAEIEGVTKTEASTYIRNVLAKSLSRSLSAIRAKETKRKEKAADPAGTAARRKIYLPDEYIPVWDAERRVWTVCEYLTVERDISLDLAKRYELGICKTGDYAGRAIFPIIEDGEVKTFTARTMLGLEPKYRHPWNDGKSTYLYGLDFAAGQEHVIVVEGPTDVIGMYRKGYIAVGLLGKSGSHEQAAKLYARGCRSVTLLLDPGAGTDVMRTALIFGEVLNVDVADLPDTADPDKATLEVVEAALAGAKPPTVKQMRLVRRRYAG